VEAERAGHRRPGGRVPCGEYGALTRIFYSHAKRLYGSETERRQISIIKERFPGSEVVDPASGGDAPGQAERDIGYFLEVVDRCDCLVFSRRMGVVTSGVLQEVNHAVSKGMPVYEIRGGGRVVQVKKGFARSSKIDALFFIVGDSVRGILWRS
jgi:hypothetical protein